MSLIDTLSRNIPNLKKAEIAGVLYLIKNAPNLTNSELIRLTGLPKEELKRLKSAMAALLEDSSDDRISFSEEGLAAIRDFHLSAYAWSLYPFIVNTAGEKSLKEIRKRNGLLPKRNYDQWFATEETSINKVTVLDIKGLLEKRTLLLGDDDLLSLTARLLNKPTKITVLDIDKDLLNTISKETKNNVTTEVYDVRKDMPSKYLGQFDTVVIDPPYTPSGVTLFLNRALEALGGSDKYIFLYYGNSFKSPEKTIKIQEIISRMGLLIEDKFDKFSRYYGAESIGSASSLYILKTTPHSRILDNPSIIENIYTFEDQGEEKFPYVDQVVIKVGGVPANVFRSKNVLTSLCQKFCETHKLKVVDTVVTDFKRGGMTLTFVLSNSNLVVHTWLEFNALHMDLITCSPIYKKEEMVNTISNLFGTKSIELYYVS